MSSVKARCGALWKRQPPVTAGRRMLTSKPPPARFAAMTVPPRCRDPTRRRRGRDLEPLLAKVPVQQPDQLRVVVDHRHSRHEVLL